MKRKIFKVLACVLVLSIVMIGLLACVDKNKDKPKDDTKSTTVDITMLPDMTDYGQSAYYNIGKADYSDSQKSGWVTELDKKQVDERGNWLLEGETWNNDNYYSFGAITGEDNNKKRQHRFGYLAQDSDNENEWYWEDSDSANTVERIFCYSEPEAFLKVLSKQGVKAEYTDGMVEYITRNDDAYNDREDYKSFEFTLGKASALQDYRELEELEEIYNDWDESEIESGTGGLFTTSEEVSDAINLKNRKISGEVFKIFGDAGDQFALTAIALLEYSTYVVENVMIPAYEAEFAKTESEYKDLVDLDEEIDKGKMAYLEGGDTTGDYADYKKLINYMREEMYDYDTLSYFLSFREYADMPIVTSATSPEAYEVGNMTEPMTLFGYHYQFRYRDYNFFDTDETYTFRNATSIVDGSQNLSMYEYFLKLGHESYFASSGTGANVRISSEDEKYALDYRRIDRDHYEQAYRYTTACLTKYYEAQLDFQVFQERMDVDLYVGGDNGTGTVLYAQGIGYAKQEPDQDYIQGEGGTKTYSEEMYNALGSNGSALDSNLKISDVNWEYTADDTIAKRFNLVSARWLSIEGTPKDEQERLLKVEYEIELLKSQDYTLNHGYMKDSDFTHALQYEIYSYSADSVRGIQQNKKNNVIYAKDAERMKAVINSETTGYDTALAELEENVGRNRAEYANLDRNYADSNVTSEINLSGSADWAGVRSNVAETLAEDYAGYVAKKGKNVDEHFEKTLIKQIYVCKTSASDPGQRGGTEDHCLVEASGKHNNYCEEDYDTNWALSRLVNNHETSLRYMYGQSEVTFARMDVSALEKDNADIAGNKFNAGSKYFIIEGNSVNTEMVDTDEKISTVLGDGKTWKNLPKYGSDDGDEFTITVNNKAYVVKFVGWYVDPELKYEVLYDEEYNYDIVVYPAYSIK